MPQRIALVARSSQQEYEVGTAISGRARLSPPSGPALTGLNDFAFESYFSGIGAIGYFYSVKAATNPSSAPPDVMAGLMLDLERLRGSISHAFEVVLPGDTGAFAASMFTNDQRAMTKETSEALRLAGLAHIIAISGLNMALAAGLFLVGFRMLFAISQRLTHAWPVKKFAALGALISLTAYYMISGFAVSAERAYVMMAIMLVAVILGRPSISLRNVATSALLILVYTPSAVMGPGFQMSYAATLALVTGYSALQRRDWGRVSASGVAILRPLLPVWKFASGIFMTSLIGGLSTALFSMEHFHRLAAWGLPANLLAMPIISFIVMPFGIIGLLCMPFHLEWLPLKIMGYGLDLVIEIAKWAASLGGEIDTGRMPGWMFAGCAFGLLALAILRSRLRYLGAALALLAFLPFFAIPQISGQRLVIFEDGKLAGIVSNRTIATNTARPPAFVMEQWQRALVSKTISVPNVLPPINIDMSARKLASEDISAARDAMRLDLVPPTDPGFTCRPKQWCFTRLGAGLRVIIVDSGGLVGPACDIADIVITSARLRWSSCRSGAMLVSAETLRRTGSLEILVPQNAIHATDLSVTAALVNPTRPWSIHRLYDWRQRKFVLDGA
jgi:ComEC/Rec2-related protein